MFRFHLQNGLYYTFLERAALDRKWPNDLLQRLRQSKLLK